MLGPGHTEGTGWAWALGTASPGRAGPRVPSPDPVLSGLCLRPEPGQPPPLLLPHPSLLSLGGSLQLLPQGTGRARKGELTGGPTRSFIAQLTASKACSLPVKLPESYRPRPPGPAASPQYLPGQRGGHEPHRELALPPEMDDRLLGLRTAFLPKLPPALGPPQHGPRSGPGASAPATTLLPPPSTPTHRTLF